jgi:hypothetical protein
MLSAELLAGMLDLGGDTFARPDSRNAQVRLSDIRRGCFQRE